MSTWSKANHLVGLGCGGWIGAMGGLTSILALVLPVAGVTDPAISFRIIGIAGILILAGSLAAKNFELNRARTPKIKAECGTALSDTRNQSRMLGIEKCLVDFLGIEINNLGTEPIFRVHADLVEITKPSKQKWRGKSALNFRPSDNRIEETSGLIIELPELRADIPEAACLLSVARVGTPMFGTLDKNWRDPTPFSELLREPGEYVFKIIVSGQGSASKAVYVALTWSWTRETASLRITTPPS